jgi:hypothetical protein
MRLAKEREVSPYLSLSLYARLKITTEEFRKLLTRYARTLN